MRAVADDRGPIITTTFDHFVPGDPTAIDRCLAWIAALDRGAVRLANALQPLCHAALHPPPVRSLLHWKVGDHARRLAVLLRSPEPLECLAEAIRHRLSITLHAAADACTGLMAWTGDPGPLRSYAASKRAAWDELGGLQELLVAARLRKLEATPMPAVLRAPPVHLEDLAILRVLSDPPGLVLTAPQIEEALAQLVRTDRTIVSVGRHTIEARLLDLLAAGLVARHPSKKRKGVGLTAAGAGLVCRGRPG